MANNRDEYLEAVQKTDPMLKWLGMIAEANREGMVEQTHKAGHPFAVFDCVAEPKCGVSALIDEKVTVTRWELGMAIVLVDRLMKKFRKGFNPLTAHRLLVTALIIAIKMQRDVRVLEYFVHRTGMPFDDVCMMERVFLYLLDWEVFITRDEVEAAIKAIELEPLPHFENGFAAVLPLSSPRLVGSCLQLSPSDLLVGRAHTRSSSRAKRGPAIRPSSSSDRLSGVKMQRPASAQQKPSVVVSLREKVELSRRSTW